MAKAPNVSAAFGENKTSVTASPATKITLNTTKNSDPNSFSMDTNWITGAKNNARQESNSFSGVKKQSTQDSNSFSPALPKYTAHSDFTSAQTQPAKNENSEGVLSKIKGLLPSFGGNDKNNSGSILSQNKNSDVSAAKPNWQSKPSEEANGIGGAINNFAPPSLSQVGTALTVGGIAVALSNSGALGNSAETKETINSVTQAVLQNSGIDTQTANNVVGALSGDKNAQLSLGLKAVNVLTNNAISEQQAGLYVKAAQGDKKAQRQVAVSAAKSAWDFFSGNTSAENPLSIESPAQDAYSVYGFTNDSLLSIMRARKDPALSYRWLVTLPDPSSDALAILNNTGVNQKDFSFYVEDVNVSLPQMQVTDVYRGGSRRKYAGQMDSGSLSLTLYEDMSFTALRYFAALQNDIYSPTLQVVSSVPSSYKNTMLIHLIDDKGIEHAVIICVGTFPTSTGSTQLGSQGSERILRQVEFSIDFCMVKVGRGIPEQALSNDTKDLKALFKSPNSDALKAKARKRASALMQ